MDRDWRGVGPWTNRARRFNSFHGRELLLTQWSTVGTLRVVSDDWLEDAAKATGVDLSRRPLPDEAVRKLVAWERAHVTRDTYWVAMGEWRLALDLSITESGLVCRQLTIEPQQGVTPTDGISSRLLHSIKLGAILQEAAAYYRKAGERATGQPRPIPSIPKRKGRWAKSDGHYQVVAFAYLMALQEAPRSPRAFLARLWAKSGVTEGQIRDDVRAARARGILTEAKPGRAGALPGPNMLPQLLAFWRQSQDESEAKRRRGKGKR